MKFKIRQDENWQSKSSRVETDDAENTARVEVLKSAIATLTESRSKPYAWYFSKGSARGMRRLKLDAASSHCMRGYGRLRSSSD